MPTAATEQGSTIPGRFVPEMSGQFLPGCRNCGGSHPLARKGDLDPDVCPDCGEPAGSPGKTFVEKASLSGGFTIWLGDAMLRAGKFFSDLAGKV